MELNSMSLWFLLKSRDLGKKYSNGFYGTKIFYVPVTSKQEKRVATVGSF